MPRNDAALSHIAHACGLAKKHDSGFLHQLQTALLMVLREQGKLDETQYHHAQERLDQQYRRENK